MKTIAKLALAALALTFFASCASKAPTVPSYAPQGQGGGYIIPAK